MKYIYFQRIRLLKNKIAAELRNMRIFAISNMNKKHENTDKLIQV